MKERPPLHLGVVAIEKGTSGSLSTKVANKYNHTKLEIKYHDTGNGWTFVSEYAWKNSISDVIGDVGMLLSPCALKSLNSIRKIQSRMVCEAQQSYLATVPPMPVMKRASSPSTTNYLPLFDSLPNITFKSSEETWNLK